MSEPTEAEKAAAAATRDAALSVACPFCGQPPGARCLHLVNRNGVADMQPSDIVHRSRVSTWKVRMHHDRLA